LLSGGKFKTDNNKNTLIIKFKNIMDKDKTIPTLSKTAVICCGNLEKMDLGWIVTEDGVKLMPFIDGEKMIKYRVNNCPCCGAYVRDCTIQP